MTAATLLPIGTLITDRCRLLGLSPSDLVRRAGLRNIDKGLRRLHKICAGDLHTASALISGLPAALEVPRETVDAAFLETQQILDEAARTAAAEHEAAWRASFRPSAYLLGTETRPTSITMFGISGGSQRWLKIPLDLTQPPVSFAAQAHAVVRRTPIVPFFGKTLGCIVNFTPDCAVRFDLDGNPVEQFGHAYRPGQVEILTSGRQIPAEEFARIVGLVLDDAAN